MYRRGNKALGIVNIEKYSEITRPSIVTYFRKFSQTDIKLNAAQKNDFTGV